MATQETAEARHGNLILTLEVHTSDSRVVAAASLTNRGDEPWEYPVGGDVPPVVQIEARDAGGTTVYGWQPPFAAAHWMSIRSLAAGASLTERAEFTAGGTVYVRSFVSGRHGFETHEVEIAPPARR